LFRNGGNLLLQFSGLVLFDSKGEGDTLFRNGGNLLLQFSGLVPFDSKGEGDTLFRNGGNLLQQVSGLARSLTVNVNVIRCSETAVRSEKFAASFLFTPRPWIKRQYIPPKRRALCEL
jgi:hypothetical protein